MTKTGTVATYGGENFPAVTLYMNGFVAGVRYYDKTYHKSVKVLGWTPGKGACSLATCAGKGTFIGNFTDQTAGKTDTTTFFSEGADIVFPVAGSVGLGSVAAAQQAGAGHYVMWVDSNGCVSDARTASTSSAPSPRASSPRWRPRSSRPRRAPSRPAPTSARLKNNGTAAGVRRRHDSREAEGRRSRPPRPGIIAGTISVNPNKLPSELANERVGARISTKTRGYVPGLCRGIR